MYSQQFTGSNYSSHHLLQGSAGTPAVFGPIYWRMIHIQCAAYPWQPTDEDVWRICQFFLNLALNIPCVTCRKNYQRWITANPTQPHCKNQLSVFRYSYELHEWVNNHLGKSTVGRPSFAQACLQYGVALQAPLPQLQYSSNQPNTFSNSNQTTNVVPNTFDSKSKTPISNQPIAKNSHQKTPLSNQPIVNNPNQKTPSGPPLNITLPPQQKRVFAIARKTNF
jgi:hypothetical protein